MSTRTPGAWYSRRTAGYDTHGQCVIASEDNGKTVAVTYQDEADAAFIVLACNSHDTLTAENAAIRGEASDLIGALRAALLDTESAPCDALPTPNNQCGCWRCNARHAIARSALAKRSA